MSMSCSKHIETVQSREVDDISASLIIKEN